MGHGVLWLAGYLHIVWKWMHRQDWARHARFRDTHVSVLVYAVMLSGIFQISLYTHAPFAMPIKSLRMH